MFLNKSYSVSFWMHKTLCEMTFIYHPEANRGKKSNHDELLKLVHPIVIRERLEEKSESKAVTVYDFSIVKALDFLKEVSRIDESKKNYYDIYCNYYFKHTQNEKFDLREVSKTFHCHPRQITTILFRCNELVHKFILYYFGNEESGIDMTKIDDVVRPYYGFIDNSIDIDEIVNKLRL